VAKLQCSFIERDLEIPADWAAKRVLLQLQGLDWALQRVVYVNEQPVGEISDDTTQTLDISKLVRQDKGTGC